MSEPDERLVLLIDQADRETLVLVSGDQWRRLDRQFGPLEVNHVNGDPLDNLIRNTIPLCRDCHHKATFPGV